MIRSAQRFNVQRITAALLAALIAILVPCAGFSSTPRNTLSRKPAVKPLPKTPPKPTADEVSNLLSIAGGYSTRIIHEDATTAPTLFPAQYAFKSVQVGYSMPKNSKTLMTITETVSQARYDSSANTLCTTENKAAYSYTLNPQNVFIMPASKWRGSERRTPLSIERSGRPIAFGREPFYVVVLVSEQGPRIFVSAEYSPATCATTNVPVAIKDLEPRATHILPIIFRSYDAAAKFREMAIATGFFKCGERSTQNGRVSKSASCSTLAANSDATTVTGP